MIKLILGVFRTVWAYHKALKVMEEIRIRCQSPPTGRFVYLEVRLMENRARRGD